MSRHLYARTADRMTRNPGWAGFHYRRPVRWMGNLACLALMAFVGVLLAWRG